MTPRERFLGVMHYRPVDRCFFHEDRGWEETYERWRREGWDPDHPPEFGCDPWIWQSRWFYPHPPFEHEVVAEDADTVTYVNIEGIVLRERKDQPKSSMPQFVRFPVETREDFRRFWKEKMKPDLAARLGPEGMATLRSYRERDIPLIVIADRWGGFFGGPRNLLGVENLCLLIYDDPAFYEEICDAYADFVMELAGQILDVTDVDCFGFWEDMGFKTGPLLGPEKVREFMLPRYRRVVDFLRGRGVELISLDSDGQVMDLIPIWLDAGINVLYPFEVQAGMDVLEVRREFGKDLRLWGGIDKRALARDEAAIDRELARVRPLVEDGGYIPFTDHAIPPDVSWGNYCYYMKELRRALEQVGEYPG